MATASASREQRVVLNGISWETYEAITAALGDRPIRLTYDRGDLEIMTPSSAHERTARLLGRMIETLAEELSIPLMGFGAARLRRAEKERGLEPDESYYVQNEPLARERVIDFLSDPPPDLALDVDTAKSSLDRLGIYAALGVPEIWRYRRGALAAHVLEKGRYVESAKSRAFPFLELAALKPFLAKLGEADEPVLIRSFRAFVRERFRTR